MKILLSLFVIIIPSLALASDLCQRSGQDLRTMLENPVNRIGFKNQGGLINGGVCWWHARLQRSALYLARFEPERAKPSASELNRILLALKQMNSVVTIPGFSDFQSFSLAYQQSLQQLLEAWQIEDGFINQQWIRGISGSFELPPEQLKKQMDRVKRFFDGSPLPVWLMLQMKGVTSHALLLVDMQVTPDGYRLLGIDSNQPLLTREITYRTGDRSLLLGKDPFVPYVGFQLDFTKLKATLGRHCGSRHLINEQIEAGQIEK